MISCPAVRPIWWNDTHTYTYTHMRNDCVCVIAVNTALDWLHDFFSLFFCSLSILRLKFERLSRNESFIWKISRTIRKIGLMSKWQMNGVKGLVQQSGQVNLARGYNKCLLFVWLSQAPRCLLESILIKSLWFHDVHLLPLNWSATTWGDLWSILCP